MKNVNNTVICVIAMLICGMLYSLLGMTQPLNTPEHKVEISPDKNYTLPTIDFQTLSHIQKSGQKRGAGGPDSYGYTWIDSDTAGGPTYSWIEISSFGTRIEDYEWYSVGGHPLDDGTAGPFSLGFSFFYEGTWFNEIYIGTNGALSFTCDDLTYDGYFSGLNYYVPGLIFPDAIVPFWADINLDTSYYHGGGDVYYWTNNTDMFIVEYYHVKPCANEPNDDSVTFEIILSGADSSITFQYKNVESSVGYWGTTLDSSSIIGIQHNSYHLGLGYFNGYWGGPMENLPHADLAIEFKKTMSLAHNVALADFHPEPWQDKCFAEGYEPLYPWAEIINTGENTEPIVPVRIEIDSSGNTVYSDEVILFNMQIGDVDTAFFSFSPAQGIYELCVHADLPGDVLPQDDTGRVTIYAQKIFYRTSFRSIEPIIDGIIQTGEWDDATEIDISRFGQFAGFIDPHPFEPLGSAFMYVKQDSQYLYLAFDIPADTNDTKNDYIHIWFEDNHNGQYDADSSEGCLYFRNRLADTTDVIHFRSFLPDYQYADTFFLVEDLERGFGHNNGHQQAELKIPFGTNELWHLNTSIDDTLALHLDYLNWSDSIYIPEWDYWQHRTIGLWSINTFYWGTYEFGELVLSSVGIEEHKSNSKTIGFRVLPNPCNRTFSIYYTVTTPGNVNIVMYDISGRRVATLINERMVPCNRSECFKLESLPTGIYFIRMETEAGNITEKITLIK